MAALAVASGLIEGVLVAGGAGRTLAGFWPAAMISACLLLLPSCLSVESSFLRAASAGHHLFSRGQEVRQVAGTTAAVSDLARVRFAAVRYEHCRR